MGKTNRDRLRNRQSDFDEKEEEFVDRRPVRKHKRKRRRREIDKTLKSLVRDGHYKEEEDDVLYDDLLEDY